MNLTIFPGTFNPIHTAHLIIAESVRSELELDKILFIPSFIPPHRDKDIIESIHRLNMVNLAIQDNKYFESSDIEFRRQEKSYTYLTIKQLIQENPELAGKINLIIGSDAFNLIDTWHESEKLSKLVNFLVVSRVKNIQNEKSLDQLRSKGFNFKIIKVPFLEISSSEIRNRIKDNKSIKYLVSKPVEEYIFDNSLFK